MTYDRFIKTLNKSIQGQILAFDEQDGDLRLLLRDGLKQVLITQAVLEKEPEEAIYTLRDFIRDGQWESDEITVTLRDGEPSIEVPAVA